MPSERQEIRHAFDGAASRYDALAEVQRRIADALMERIPARADGLAVDAGCGTGYLGRSLAARNPALRILSCDLAPNMAQRAPAPALAADLEHLPLATASLDLYLSSLAWQWSALPNAVGEAARVLRPGGRLYVASLGPATLQELRAAFQHADARPHVRQFCSVDETAAALDPRHWQIERIDQKLFEVHGPTVRALIESVRGLGAGVLPARRGGLFGKQAWQRMEQAYEARRTPAGLPLSYEAIFITAVRK